MQSNVIFPDRLSEERGTELLRLLACADLLMGLLVLAVILVLLVQPISTSRGGTETAMVPLHCEPMVKSYARSSFTFAPPVLSRSVAR